MTTTIFRSNPVLDRVDTPLTDALRHSYPCWLDEGRIPMEGDVARCGYVKRGATDSGGEFGTPEACIVCEELSPRR